MAELWQLFNEDSSPINGRGAYPDDVLKQGLLSGASHVWLWRITKDSEKQILLQRRSAHGNYPLKLDISAAGHINLNETPRQAAIRETKEEIGLTVTPDQLQEVYSFHINTKVPESINIENSHCWVYVMNIPADTDFELLDGEVVELLWKSLDDFKTDIADPETFKSYVPHAKKYLNIVIDAVMQQDAA